MANNVLFVTAHADDHVACAGTLLKLKDKGYDLYEVVLTDSGEGRDYRDPYNGHSGDVTAMRRWEFEQATEILGTKRVFWLEQEDLSLAYSKRMVFELVKVIREIRPEVGVIHAGFDWHPDHRQAYQIGSEAFKMAATDIMPELGGHHRTPIVLASEGSLTIRPNVLVDVTAYGKQKRRLWEAYLSQASPEETAYLEGLAAVRGYQMWQRGVRLAEAFHTDPSSPIILFG